MERAPVFSKMISVLLVDPQSFDLFGGKVMRQTQPVENYLEPLSSLRCHVRKWSSISLRQSESFTKLSADSEQNDSPLVSNKHLFSIFRDFLAVLQL